MVSLNSDQPLLVEIRNDVAIVTLNRPTKLNCITVPMLEIAIDRYKRWEEDDSTKFIIVKGIGRVFCAGGDLRMFYELGKSNEGWTKVVYLMYWFHYHVGTFKKPIVTLLHGLVMGAGAGLSILSQFRVATEKTIFAMPEAAIGFYTDCAASYWLTHHLSGPMGKYVALLGARLDGAELYISGLATHYVPFEKLAELEQRLVGLKSCNAADIDAAIKEFVVPAQIKPDSVFNEGRQALIERVFSKGSVEEILEALEAELKVPGQEWVKEPINILKRSSPTSLKMTFRSLSDGVNETLDDALRREYRLTINCLRATISEDIFEGIRAILVEKDNAPKWKPDTLEEIREDDLDKIIRPFEEQKDLCLPSIGKVPRWGGNWEDMHKLKFDTLSLSKISNRVN